MINNACPGYGTGSVCGFCVFPLMYRIETPYRARLLCFVCLFVVVVLFLFCVCVCFVCVLLLFCFVCLLLGGGGFFFPRRNY